MDIRRETFTIAGGSRDNRAGSFTCSDKAIFNRGLEGDPSDATGLGVDLSFAVISGNPPAQGVAIESSVGISPAESCMGDVTWEPIICRQEVGDKIAGVTCM